jgi:threonine aldolase
MIDLRSDTVTRLAPAMGQTMAAADTYRALDVIARSIATSCLGL